MNYLVTGGAGFVGSQLAKSLLIDGHTVTIIDNLRTGYLENIPEGALFIEGDCGKISTIESLGEQKFDAIFHIAGQSSGEISFEDPLYDLSSNTISTLLLLQYAVKHSCKKFVYASTMSVYGDHPKECMSESDDCNPRSFYAVGKLASENYLQIFHRQYGIDYTALRYFNIYGPGQNMDNMKQGMVSIYLKQIVSSEYPCIEVKGSLDRFRDFIYIDDVVKVTRHSMSDSRFSNKISNVGTGVKTTVAEVIKTLQEVTNSNKKILELPPTPGDQRGVYADTSFLKSIYPHSFVTFQEGVKRFVEGLNGI